MSADDYAHEREILMVMKKVLTDIAKETFTKPGFRHPLSDSTIENMRQCLGLISAREMEIVKACGESMDMRPRYVDEPTSKQASVVVKLDAKMTNTSSQQKPDNK